MINKKLLVVCLTPFVFGMNIGFSAESTANAGEQVSQIPENAQGAANPNAQQPGNEANISQEGQNSVAEPKGDLLNSLFNTETQPQNTPESTAVNPHANISPTEAPVTSEIPVTPQPGVNPVPEQPTAPAIENAPEQRVTVPNAQTISDDDNGEAMRNLFNEEPVQSNVNAPQPEITLAPEQPAAPVIETAPEQTITVPNSQAISDDDNGEPVQNNVTAPQLEVVSVLEQPAAPAIESPVAPQVETTIATEPQSDVERAAEHIKNEAEEKIEKKGEENQPAENPELKNALNEVDAGIDETNKKVADISSQVSETNDQMSNLVLMMDARLGSIESKLNEITTPEPSISSIEAKETSAKTVLPESQKLDSKKPIITESPVDTVSETTASIKPSTEGQLQNTPELVISGTSVSVQSAEPTPKDPLADPNEAKNQTSSQEVINGKTKTIVAEVPTDQVTQPANPSKGNEDPLNTTKATQTDSELQDIATKSQNMLENPTDTTQVPPMQTAQALESTGLSPVAQKDPVTPVEAEKQQVTTVPGTSVAAQSTESIPQASVPAPEVLVNTQPVIISGNKELTPELREYINRQVEKSVNETLASAQQHQKATEAPLKVEQPTVIEDKVVDSQVSSTETKVESDPKTPSSANKTEGVEESSYVDAKPGEKTSEDVKTSESNEEKPVVKASEETPKTEGVKTTESVSSENSENPSVQIGSSDKTEVTDNSKQEAKISDQNSENFSAVVQSETQDKTSTEEKSEESSDTKSDVSEKAGTSETAEEQKITENDDSKSETATSEEMQKDGQEAQTAVANTEEPENEVDASEKAGISEEMQKDAQETRTAVANAEEPEKEIEASEVKSETAQASPSDEVPNVATKTTNTVEEPTSTEESKEVAKTEEPVSMERTPVEDKKATVKQRENLIPNNSESTQLLKNTMNQLREVRNAIESLHAPEA